MGRSRICRPPVRDLTMLFGGDYLPRFDIRNAFFYITRTDLFGTLPEPMSVSGR